jgi:hypothetical protein
MIAPLLLLFSAAAAEPPKARPTLAPASTDVREARPLAVAASALGKTPFGGAIVEVNMHPHVALGLGFGYFSAGSVSGNFIPLYLQGYALRGNLSPYVFAGADFLTVKFESSNTLFSSTFRGTQWLVGAGGEWRLDSGWLARVEVARFLDAAIWIPGLTFGYSFPL